MNGFDIIVLATIAVTGLFAFAAGFVRVALFLATWAGAAFAALYGFPYVQPMARKLVESPFLADLAAGAALFIVALVVLTILANLIANRVRGSALSALDRTLGLVLGLALGVFITCMVHVGIDWTIPASEQPAWIKEARTRPLLAEGAERLKALLPRDGRSRSAEAAEAARRRLEQANEARKATRALAVPLSAQPAGETTPGYKPAERKDLDRLIESAQ